MLYVRSPLMERLSPPFVDVRSAPFADGWRSSGMTRAFETSQQSVALRLGLGKALADVERLRPEVIALRVGELATELRRRLAEVPGVVAQRPRDEKVWNRLLHGGGPCRRRSTEAIAAMPRPRVVRYVPEEFAVFVHRRPALVKPNRKIGDRLPLS